jgi:hypothetical protein
MRFLALVVVIIGACFFFLSVKPTETCPNPTFVKKHMCPGQPTAENALECSRQRNQNPQLSSTNKNTVFIGTSDFEQVGTDCINRVNVENVTKCSFDVYSKASNLNLKIVQGHIDNSC